MWRTGGVQNVKCTAQLSTNWAQFMKLIFFDSKISIGWVVVLLENDTQHNSALIKHILLHPFWVKSLKWGEGAAFHRPQTFLTYISRTDWAQNVKSGVQFSTNRTQCIRLILNPNFWVLRGYLMIFCLKCGDGEKHKAEVRHKSSKIHWTYFGPSIHDERGGRPPSVVIEHILRAGWT